MDPYSRSTPGESSGLVFASLPDGRRLPIIDLTHPGFAATLSDEDIETCLRLYETEAAARGEPTDAVWAALAQSTIGRALGAASGSYLGGLATYLLKLGPEHLGSCDSPVDRWIAASFPALMVRVRLQDVVNQLASGMSARLSGGDGTRPLLLLNIAGGAAADSWNALTLLRRTHPELLNDRAVTIAVLDIDREGPAFGAAAIDVLSGAGAALDGVHVSYRHIEYDWSNPDALVTSLTRLRARDAMCAVSSEGGLFEYGTDDAVVANLRALAACTGSDTVVVGSVTHDGERARRLTLANGPATVPRSLDAFSRLADGAGWTLDACVERPFSRQVRLIRA